LSSVNQIRAPFGIFVILVSILLSTLPRVAQARSMKKCNPCPVHREPEKAIHVLKDIYCDVARHEPGEVHETFQRMSRDALSYFLGALPVFCWDLAALGRPWAHEPVGPKALLLGDAHILNLGTVRDGQGALIFDWIRLDQAAPGPILVDVRRWLVSLILLADEIATDVPDSEALLRDALRSYREGLSRFSGNSMTAEFAMSQENAAPFVRKMLRNASHRTRQQLLDRWTVTTSAGRRFRTQEEFLPVPPELRESFEHALSGTQAPGRGPVFFHVKDATRRVYGSRRCQGHERVYLLVEGLTEALEDDVILEASMKPMSTLDHFLKGATPPSDGNALRVTDAAYLQRHFDESRRVMNAAVLLRRSPEPFLRTIQLCGDTYLVEEVQPWETRLSTESLEGLADLHDLARASGTLLARAHALTIRAPDQLVSFLTTWDRHPVPMENALVKFALIYAAQTHVDFAAFRTHVAAKPLLVVPDRGRAAKGHRHRLHHHNGAESSAR